MNVNSKLPICPFCNGDSNFSYRLSGYDIWTCNSCHAGFVHPMPSNNELNNYYKGFLFQIESHSYKKILNSFSIFLPYLGIKKKKNKLLDVGGGGGFFSRAFQELDYGSATYIDLDSEACSYAKASGIDNVFCGPIDAVPSDLGCFDLVFARHIIEHVIEPTDFINKAYKMLNSGGKLILLMPNGLSKEYLSLPLFMYRKIKKIILSNRFNFKLIFRSLGKEFHHGIDPLRHLWAINSDSLSIYCKQMDYTSEIKTFSVSNKMVSPYFRYNLLSLPHLFFGKHLAALSGGAHLLCVITKDSN